LLFLIPSYSPLSSFVYFRHQSMSEAHPA
jgi:hypothetical protein